MMLKRVMGKASFATMQDMSGRIQLYVTRDDVGEAASTKRSSTGIWATSSARTARCSGPAPASFRSRSQLDPPARQSRCARLPEKFHGLTDQEQRYRQRYLDLITNPESQTRVQGALADHPGDPRVLRRARLSRSGNADDAADPGRRGGAAVRHASQRARHAAVPAHRAGAVSEAAGGRRLREGVRDQSQLPQRRHLDAPQSRVHDARVLRGLSGLPLPDGPHRGDAARGCARR